MPRRRKLTKSATVPSSPITAVLKVEGNVAHLCLPDARWTIDLVRAPSQLALPVQVALEWGTSAKLEEPEPLAKGEGPTVEYGIQTNDFHEYFLSSASGPCGVLVVKRKGDGWVSTMSKSLLPFVLTKQAAKQGVMPPEGTSALPKSLEAVVPIRLRYWQQPAAQAVVVRNALVKAGTFHERLLKLVDGSIRLCVERLFLYEPTEEELNKGEERALVKALHETVGDLKLVQPFLAEDWKAELEKHASSADAFLLLSSPDDSPVELVAEVLRLQPTAKWLVEHEDTPANQAELSKLGRLFKVDGYDGVFVSSAILPGMQWVEEELPEVQSAEVQAQTAEPAEVEKALSARVLKADEEQRYVLGIVLEPEVVDAQNDIYSAQEIASAAHTFMEKYRTMGLMHKAGVNDKVKILESYLMPADAEVQGVPLKAGTWMMAVKVLDDDLWAAVKDGGLTGFSIGGSAIRTPETPAEGTQAPAN